MAKSSNDIITSIEYKYKVKAIQSEATGLYYLYDDERKALGILAIIEEKPVYTILSKKQLRALRKELKGICEVFLDEQI